MAGSTNRTGCGRPPAPGFRPLRLPPAPRGGRRRCPNRGHRRLNCHQAPTPEPVTSPTPRTKDAQHAHDDRASPEVRAPPPNHDPAGTCPGARPHAARPRAGLLVVPLAPAAPQAALTCTSVRHTSVRASPSEVGWPSPRLPEGSPQPPECSTSWPRMAAPSPAPPPPSGAAGGGSGRGPRLPGRPLSHRTHESETP